MNKQEFLDELRKGLCGLPENDVDERLDFYSEMIDDLTEDCLSQEEAVPCTLPTDFTNPTI